MVTREERISVNTMWGWVTACEKRVRTGREGETLRFRGGQTVQFDGADILLTVEETTLVWSLEDEIHLLALGLDVSNICDSAQPASISAANAHIFACRTCHILYAYSQTCIHTHTHTTTSTK